MVCFTNPTKTHNSAPKVLETSKSKTKLVKASPYAVLIIQVCTKPSHTSTVINSNLGTESETVPLYVPSGSTEPLTCPIESDYYTHEGSSTSAQYYLNPIGVTPPNACSWDGQGDGKTGNWAPIVLGVGNTGGTNWLSIQQNTPTSYAQYEGTVEIVGDSCSGTCKYSNGQYCLNGGSCASNTQNGAGCTVSHARVM